MMKKQLIRAALYTAVAAAITIPMGANATNGNQPTGSGQASRGAAGAGIAFPQDTIAPLINPAAGVHVGNRVDAGIELFSPDRDLTLGGQTYDGNETDVFPVPELGYNKMLGSDKAFNILLSAAGGQNTDYKLHPLLGGPAMVDLAQVFIVPSYSMKVGNNSFGVSLNLVYQTFEAEGLGALSAASSNPSKFTDNGSSDATGAGVGFGWIGEINSTLSLGAMYQSEISMSDFDEYVGLFPGGAVDIPEKYGVGLAVKAAPKVSVLFDINQVNYSSTKALGNSTEGDGMSPLGFSNGPGFGWDDITIYRLGVVYEHNASLTLRAGWNHGDNPVPNETFNDAFFNSLTPGITKDHLALGFTKQINPGLSVTGSYVHTFDETLKGNGVKLTEPGAGTPAADLRMEQDAIGITVSWHL